METASSPYDARRPAATAASLDLISIRKSFAAASASRTHGQGAARRGLSIGCWTLPVCRIWKSCPLNPRQAAGKDPADSAAVAAASTSPVRPRIKVFACRIIVMLSKYLVNDFRQATPYRNSSPTGKWCAHVTAVITRKIPSAPLCVYLAVDTGQYYPNTTNRTLF